MRILTLLFVLCAAVSVVSAQPSASASPIEIVEAGEEADLEAILTPTPGGAPPRAAAAASTPHVLPSPAPAAPPPIPPPER